jgi:hypothetical protein
LLFCFLLFFVVVYFEMDVFFRADLNDQSDAHQRAVLRARIATPHGELDAMTAHFALGLAAQLRAVSELTRWLDNIQQVRFKTTNKHIQKICYTITLLHSRCRDKLTTWGGENIAFASRAATVGRRSQRRAKLARHRAATRVAHHRPRRSTLRRRVAALARQTTANNAVRIAAGDARRRNVFNARRQATQTYRLFLCKSVVLVGARWALCECIFVTRCVM